MHQIRFRTIVVSMLSQSLAFSTNGSHHSKGYFTKCCYSDIVTPLRSSGTLDRPVLACTREKPPIQEFEFSFIHEADLCVSLNEKVRMEKGQRNVNTDLGDPALQIIRW